MNQQIRSAAPAAARQMPSAGGTGVRPDAFAVSPAIGALPAICVPPSRRQAAAPSARQGLIGRGVKVSDIRHKSPVGDWKGGWQPGADPQRRDYAGVADFADPDGNTWVLQEIGYWPGTHQD